MPPPATPTPYDGGFLNFSGQWLIGQTIRAPYNGSATYFGPWFPRQGVRASFVCNPIAVASVDSLAITVETKLVGDDTKDTTVHQVDGGSTSFSPTAEGIEVIDCGLAIDASDDGSGQGFLDLVRFKYVLTSSTNMRGWVHCRMLEPCWEND